MFKFVVLL